MKEFYIDNDGIRLHAKLDLPAGMEHPGKKSIPLVLVFHGLTGHMEERHITAITEAINEAGFAALRVDSYGHGKSEGAFHDHTLYKWITGGLAVMDYVKENFDFYTDLYLCGHSQGGLLVMLLAGMRPNEVKALLPLAPAWMIPDYARMGTVLGSCFDPVNIQDEFEIWGRTISGNYVRTAQTIHVEDEIARYSGPVLIVQGEADEAVPREYAERAKELYKNAKLVMIPEDSHCYDRHLDLVTEEIKKFLKE